VSSLVSKKSFIIKRKQARKIGGKRGREAEGEGEQDAEDEDEEGKMYGYYITWK